MRRRDEPGPGVRVLGAQPGAGGSRASREPARGRAVRGRRHGDGARLLRGPVAGDRGGGLRGRAGDEARGDHPQHAVVHVLSDARPRFPRRVFRGRLPGVHGERGDLAFHQGRRDGAHGRLRGRSARRFGRARVGCFRARRRCGRAQGEPAPRDRAGRGRGRGRCGARLGPGVPAGRARRRRRARLGRRLRGGARDGARPLVLQRPGHLRQVVREVVCQVAEGDERLAGRGRRVFQRAGVSGFQPAAAGMQGGGGRADGADPARQGEAVRPDALYPRRARPLLPEDPRGVPRRGGALCGLLPARVRRALLARVLAPLRLGRRLLFQGDLPLRDRRRRGYGARRRRFVRIMRGLAL